MSVEAPEVTVSQGTLRGSTATDFDGGNYFRFQGVPYARPPLGKLRFEAPVPPEKWLGVLDATKEGHPSYGRHPYDKNRVQGSEDCLYLNIYTKHIGDKILNPVMFYIHGGIFIYGSGSTELYGPEFLLMEDVILVTVNYRLGLLGFLSLEDPSLEVPGNAGLKDIVMALKWVQSNIHAFGGDPKNVTVFGQSSGAMTVDLLRMSDMSKGLFAKAISQSGCAVSTFTRAKRGAGEVSKVLNIEDERSIYDKLMEMSVEKIHQIQEKIFEGHVPSKPRTIGYVIEKKSKLEAFLTEDPLTILQKGTFCHVPYLTGFTSAEFLSNRPIKSAPGFNTCEDAIPFFLGHQVGSRSSMTIAKKLRRFYFGSEDLSKVNITKKGFIMLDTGVFYELYLTVLHHLQKSQAPLYVYRLSLDTKLNFCKTLFKIRSPGASHSDDIGYLFTNFLTPDIKSGSVEDRSMRRVVRLWTNFARCGDPTPKYDPLLDVVWKPVTTEDVDFLDIGEKLLASRNPEEFQRAKFLKQVFDEGITDTSRKIKSAL